MTVQQHLNELSDFLWKEVINNPPPDEDHCVCGKKLDSKKEPWGSMYCQNCYINGW